MMRAADTRSQEQLKVLEKNNKLLKTEKDSLREVGARHCVPIVWDSSLTCATFLVELSLRDLILVAIVPLVDIKKKDLY